MARGNTGHRAGPAPDPNALRRDRPSDQAGWTTLPAEGRVGDPPPWPLTRPTMRERTLWTRQWCRPQALKWAERGQEEAVALYVRALVAAERPKASPPSRVLVLRLADELGISNAGLRLNRWRIGEPAKAESAAPSADSGDPTPIEDIRERLRARTSA